MIDNKIKGDPLKGSRKLYVTGNKFPIRVGMREILLSTKDKETGQPDTLAVYDTSGPFGDAGETVDLTRGVKPCVRTGLRHVAIRSV